MKKFGILACLVFAIPNIAPVQASAVDPLSVAATFERLTAGSALANPSVAVIDQLTHSMAGLWTRSGIAIVNAALLECAWPYVEEGGYVRPVHVCM